MDFVFECFYENTIESMTRSGLKDRRARHYFMEHLTAVIDGASSGQNMQKEEVAKIAVIEAVNYHRMKKGENSKVCLMGKFHNILYIALRTCWEWGVRDSSVVVMLLDEIYKCEKTFERLFLGALFGSNAPYFLAGWKSDFKDQNENTRAVVYFLNHASNEGYHVPVKIDKYHKMRNMKFVDVPIESCGKSSPLRVAIQASEPEVLMILLRYGAEPLSQDGGASPILALLDKLIDNDDRKYSSHMIICLQLILKNIVQIEIPYKPLFYEQRKTMFLEKYGTLLVDGIITKEQCFGVVPLKHLCRCRIRNLLRNNDQLPNGIDTLRVPNKIQRYIDLTEN